MDVTLPNGQAKIVTPFLFSIVADAPEVCVLLSSRFGRIKFFPCPRCWVSNDDIGFIDPDEYSHKTSCELNDIYKEIKLLKHATERESQLQNLSLRVPESVLLSRFEFSLQSSISYGSPSSSDQAEYPFNISSCMKFESMHNLDLGLTVDILRGIEEYFSVSVSGASAIRITDSANQFQSFLPRRSQTGSFRLPAPGTMIAKAYANVNAYQYFSLCFLPFVLIGSTALVKLEALYYLVKFIILICSYTTSCGA